MDALACGVRGSLLSAVVAAHFRAPSTFLQQSMAVLKTAAKRPLRFYSESRNRKYEDDHSAVGIVFCGRAVRMILKISWSAASSSRNGPPMDDSSDWIFASSRRAS